MCGKPVLIALVGLGAKEDKAHMDAHPKNRRNTRGMNMTGSALQQRGNDAKPDALHVLPSTFYFTTATATKVRGATPGVVRTRPQVMHDHMAHRLGTERLTLKQFGDRCSTTYPFGYLNTTNPILNQQTMPNQRKP